MRRILSTLFVLLLIFGCNRGDSKSTPTPPTTPTTPTPTVTSVAVAATRTPNGFQCVATAILSDNTAQVVTNQSTWTTSDAAIATVDASGLVTTVKAGDFDVRATYQGVTGTQRLTATVPEPPAPTTYALSGNVTDSGTTRAISGATVSVVDGTDAGKSATTDGSGAYRITAVSAGSFRLRASASGYTASERSLTVNADTRTDFSLTATCPVPSAPTGLAASVSDQTVNFSWTAPAGTVTDYVLEVGTASGSTNVDTKTASGPSYTWTRVPAGTYYSRVRARNSCGTGSVSNEVSYTVVVPTYTVSGTVRDTQNSAAVAGASVLVVDGASAGRTATTDAAGEFALTAVQAGTFTIRTSRTGYTTADQLVTASGHTTVEVRLVRTCPEAPTNYTVSLVGTTATFSWSAPGTGGTPADYLVEIGTSSGGSNTLSATSTNTTHTWTNIPSGTFFSRVKARNVCGTSGASNEVSFTVVVPQTYTVTGTVRDTQDNNGLGGASVQIVSGTNSGRSASTDGSGNFSITAVQGGSFTLRTSKVGYTATDQSVTVNADTRVDVRLVRTCPDPPANFIASVAGTAVTFTWTAGAAAGQPADYIVEIGTSSGSANTNTATTTSTSYIWSPAPTGSYFSRVKARNVCGTSSASAEVPFTVTSSSTTCSGAAVPSLVDCGTPTARCNDATYSCAQTRAAACGSNGGVSCWVCPGVLCTGQLAAASFRQRTESCGAGDGALSLRD